MLTKEEQVAEFKKAQDEALSQIEAILTGKGLTFEKRTGTWTYISITYDNLRALTRCKCEASRIEITGTPASFGFSHSSVQVLPLKFKVECQEWSIRKGFRPRTFGSIEKAIAYAEEILNKAIEDSRQEFERQTRVNDMSVRVQPIIEALKTKVPKNWDVSYVKDRYGYLSFGPYGHGIKVFLSPDGWKENNTIEFDKSTFKITELRYALSILEEVMTTIPY